MAEVDRRHGALNEAPLSRSQASALFSCKLAGNTALLHLPAAVRLQGPLDPSALTFAIDAVVARHDVLRSVFVEVEGRTIQRALPHRPFSLERVRVHEGNAETRLARAVQLAEVNATIALDRETQGPFRAVLYELAEDDHVLLLVVHHVAWDGWSIGLFVRELQLFYEAKMRGTPSGIEPLPLQYADVARGEERALSVGVLEPLLAAAEDELRDMGRARLPVDRPRGMTSRFSGDMVYVNLPMSTGQGVVALARRLGATPFMVLSAAFSAVLHRYAGFDAASDHARFALGTPLANRGRPEVAPLIGYFAQVVPIVHDLAEGPTFEQHVAAVRHHTLAAQRRETLPFDVLVERLGGARTADQNPIFDAMFALHAESLDRMTLSGMTLSPIDLKSTVNHFDLGLHLWPRGKSFAGYFSFATGLFDAATVARMASHYATLLAAAVAEPTMLVSDLPLLSDEEQVWLRARGRDALSRTDLLPRLHQGLPEGFGAGGQALTLRDHHDQQVPIGVEGRVFLGDAHTLDLGVFRPSGELSLTGSVPGYAFVRGERVALAHIEAALRSDKAVAYTEVFPRSTAQGTALTAAVTLRRGVSRQALEQRAEGAHVLLLDRAPLGPLAVDSLPVLESALLSRVEQQVSALPGVRGARAFLSPNVQAAREVHASDVLAGYTRSGKVDLSTTTEQAAEGASRLEDTRPLAYTSGGPLTLPEGAPQTLVEALLRAASRHPERGLTLIEEDGSRAFLSYKNLLERAQRVAAGLGQEGFGRGRYAVLQVPSLPSHFVAFWGCALAGVVPVTVALAPSYSEPSAILSKLWGIASLLDDPVVIGDRCTRGLLAGVPQVLGHTQPLHAVAIEDLEERGVGAPFVPIAPRPEDVLFLQLTSGSTGIPKCIQETHRAVIHHVHGARVHNGYQDSDVDLSFLPFDHVVPTLTCHLKDVYLGLQQIHVRTSHVLHDPLRWLALLEEHRVTHTWAPNFGFKLVADALVAQPERRFDLSSVRLFMNAGEQVTLPVVREFLRLTLPFGVSPRAMQPAFGMAEAATCMTWENAFDLTTGTLRVAKSSLGRDLQTASPDEDGIDFVGLGPTMPGVEVRIAGEHNETLRERTIGRLQIRGAVVTPGYLKNDEANREAFPGDGWLDSGDLGFLAEGRLFVTGRKKEMIVVRGANLYCYEIEDVVGRLPWVLPTFVAACAVEDRGAGTESVAVFFVPKPTDRGEDGPVDGALLRSIRGAVGRELGVTPAFVLPLTRATFPKTTSGKIQRMALKKALARGELDALVRRADFLLDNEHVLGPWFFRWLWRREARRPGAGSPLPSSCLVLGAGTEASALAAHLGATYHPAHSPLPSAPVEVLIHALGLDAPADGALPNLEGCLGPGLRRLVVVTRGALAVGPNEAPVPARAAWQGLLASVAEEQPASARLVDVEGPLTADALAALTREVRLPDDEPVVALRGAARFVRRLEDATPTRPVSPPIVRGGLYLVTGGLGGLGSALAERLLRDFGVTLLLTGRAPTNGDLTTDAAGLAPPRSLAERTRTLARLSALGAVLFEEADVSDKEAMAQVIQRAEASQGRRLDGVFHLAGVFPTRLVNEETSSTLGVTYQPKVMGAEVLSALVPDDRLFVAVSSVYGAFGAAAAGAYAAASSALDAVIAERRHRGLVRSFSLDCSLVRDIGMSRGFAFEESAAALGFRMLDAERALSSLLVALGGTAGQVLVGLDASKENVRRLLDGPPQNAESMVVFCQGPAPGIEARDAFGVPFRPRLVEVNELPTTAFGGADLTRTKEGPRTPTQRAIAEIWGELLKIPSVDVDTSFFALGGQSLLLVQALGRVNQRLHQNLVVVDLFRYPTIRGLADLIDQRAPTDVTPKAEKAEARAEKQREAARARAALRGRGSK